MFLLIRLELVVKGDSKTLSTSSQLSSGMVVRRPPIALCHSFHLIPSRTGFESGIGPSWNSGGGGNLYRRNRSCACSFLTGYFSHSTYPFQPGLSSMTSRSTSGPASSRSANSSESCVLIEVVDMKTLDWFRTPNLAGESPCSSFHSSAGCDH